jgi:hypothetical protein
VSLLNEQLLFYLDLLVILTIILFPSSEEEEEVRDMEQGQTLTQIALVNQ